MEFNGKHQPEYLHLKTLNNFICGSHLGLSVGMPESLLEGYPEAFKNLVPIDHAGFKRRTFLSQQEEHQRQAIHK